MIDCRQVCEALEIAYLDGPEPNLSDEVREHLEQCANCQRESQELQNTWLLLHSCLETSPVSPDLEASVMRRITEVGSSAPTNLARNEPNIVFWKYALAASVFVALTLSILWSRQANDSMEVEVANSEKNRLQTLKEQMQNLQELENAFGQAQLHFASLQSVGVDSNVLGLLVYDYKAGEGHFFGFNFDAAPGELYKLWLLTAEQNVISSSVIRVDAETMRGSSLIKFPADTSRMKEVIVTIEDDEGAATPSDKVQLRSPVQPKPL